MTDEQITEHLTNWVKDYCHNDFEDGLPGGVLLFLDQALNFQKSTSMIKSENLGDYSITFRDDYPESSLKLLRPYKRARGVDDSGDAWKADKRS